jgi:hypothetical protein
MNTVLLFLGILTIILGLVVSYVLLAFVFKLEQVITKIQAQSLTQAQKNGIINTTLIGGVIVFIGVLITREALKDKYEIKL